MGEGAVGALSGVRSTPEGLWLPANRSRALVGLAVGLVCPVLAALLTTTGPLEQFPSLPFTACIIGSTLVGRLAAGVLATVVSTVLLDYYVVPPVHSLVPGGGGELVESVIFLLVGLAISVVLARHSQAQAAARRAERLAATAQQRLELLSEVSSALTSSFQLSANLDAACAAITKGAWDGALVFTLDSGKARYVAGSHRDAGRLASLGDRRTAPALIDEVLRTRTPHQIKGTSTEADELIGGSGVRSGLVLPLLVNDTAVGALALIDTEQSRGYPPADLAVGRELAARIARAVESVRLYEQQVHIARTLQQGLLPRSLPSIPGLELHARHQAGGAGTEVGGDFYDLFAIDDHTWMAVVGDVCGKGPEAASVMTIVRATLRAIALRERSPRRLLDFVNEALLDQVPEQRFATVCCATIDASDQGARVIVSLAGHPPPIVVRGDGKLESVTGANGPLLGVFPDVSFRQATIQLAPGESMVFYTDGIESRGVTAEEQARTLLDAVGNGSADGIIEAFTAKAKAAPAVEADDLVVLVVEATGARKEVRA